MMQTTVMADCAQAEIEQVLAHGLVQSVYQPIVNLNGGDVVAYEALARGIPASPLESPAAMFAAARAVDRVDELDRLCAAKALQGAAGLLHRDQRLFVNIEPPSGTSTGPRDPAAVTSLVPPTGTRVMVELTERALTDRPAQLLALVPIRARGWGVALDDVGADGHER